MAAAVARSISPARRPVISQSTSPLWSRGRLTAGYDTEAPLSRMADLIDRRRFRLRGRSDVLRCVASTPSPPPPPAWPSPERDADEWSPERRASRTDVARRTIRPHRDHAQPDATAEPRPRPRAARRLYSSASCNNLENLGYHMFAANAYQCPETRQLEESLPLNRSSLLHRPELAEEGVAESPTSPHDHDEEPALAGVSVSEEEKRCLDDLIVRFVSYSIDEFKKVDGTDHVELDDDWQSKTYAGYALQHYNENQNKIKYELVQATKSCYIMDAEGSFGHVNFIARARHEDSEGKLFFAELHHEDGTMIPTCFCMLHEEDQVGRVELGDNGICEPPLEINMKFCYACSSDLLHPKNEGSYRGGHFTCPGYYDYD